MNTLSELELFELKQKFLSVIPHPTLILKHIKRIDASFVSSESYEDNHAELLTFLDDYMEHLLTLKLNLSNSLKENEVLNALVELYRLQGGLIHKLSLYKPDELEQSAQSVKLSDPFDTHACVKEMKAHGIEESEIKTYLCGQLETEEKTQLFTDVVRAWKIENHGR